MRMASNRRGIALVLVLAVVAMVFVLSGGYMAQQAVSVQLARNLSNRTQARMIAESGLEMALAYVGSDANWKTAKTPGTWGQNVSFGGGVFTVIGQAGQDPNGSGIVVGNGSFTADPTQSLTLTAVGTFKEANWASQAVVTPSGSTISSGVIVATAVSISMEPRPSSMSPGATIDSFDSTLGPYGSGNSGSNAHVVTDSTQAGAVSIGTWSYLNGLVAAGPGTDVTKTVSISMGGTYTGTTTTMSATVPMPTITVPNLGATQAAVSYATGSTNTLSQSLHVASLSVGTGGKLKISGNVVVVTDGAFTVNTGANLEVLPNSSLKVYCQGGITINTGAANVVDGQNLDRLTLYNVGTTPVTLMGGGSLYGVVISPNAPINVTTGFQLCGALVAQSLSLTSGTAIHEDLRITSGIDSIVLGGTGTPKARWVK
jgi:hypothetical protein